MKCSLCGAHISGVFGADYRDSVTGLQICRGCFTSTGCRNCAEKDKRIAELEAVVERKDIELMAATNPVVPKEEWKQYVGEWKTRAERAEAKIKRDEKRTVQEHRTFDHNEKLLKGQLETKDALLRNALDDLKYIVTCLECIEKATMKSIPLADRFRTTMANIKVEIQ